MCFGLESRPLAESRPSQFEALNPQHLPKAVKYRGSFIEDAYFQISGGPSVLGGSIHLTERNITVARMLLADYEAWLDAGMCLPGCMLTPVVRAC